MSTQVESRSFNELSKALVEAENLSSLQNPNSQQRTRISVLLAKISALKSGVNVDELRHWEKQRLAEEAGLPRLAERARGRLDEDTESEWRNFAQGKPVRECYIPPKREIRAYAGQQAGQQSITSSTGAAGGFFVAPGMSPRLYENLRKSDSIFDPDFCNIVETATGADMPFPIFSDVENAAVLVSETVGSVEVKIANISNAQLHAYAYRTQIVAVSIELLEDSVLVIRFYPC